MTFSVVLEQYIKLLILSIGRYRIIFPDPSILLKLIPSNLITIVPGLCTLQEGINIGLHFRLASKWFNNLLL